MLNALASPEGIPSTLFPAPHAEPAPHMSFPKMTYFGRLVSSLRIINLANRACLLISNRILCTVVLHRPMQGVGKQWLARRSVSSGDMFMLYMTRQCRHVSRTSAFNIRTSLRHLHSPLSYSLTCDLPAFALSSLWVPRFLRRYPNFVVTGMATAVNGFVSLGCITIDRCCWPTYTGSISDHVLA